MDDKLNPLHKDDMCDPSFWNHNHTLINPHLGFPTHVLPHISVQLYLATLVLPLGQELKRHFASEHGDELKMSRAQRREAFAVPVNLQYRGRDDADAQQTADVAAAVALHERATTVIGGGQGFTARMGPRAVAMHHSRSEPNNLNSAVQV